MAASTTVSPLTGSRGSSSPLITSKHKKAEVASLVARAVAEGMSQFAKEYLEKIERCREEALKEVKDTQLLRQGPWYATDLYRACEDLGDQDFIAFIRKYNKFVEGYMGSEKFTMRGPDASNPEHQSLYFRAKPTEDAYQLAMDATKNFAIIDCGVAVTIIQIQVLARCLGKEKFNLVFSEKGLGHLNFTFICMSTTDQPLGHFLKPTEASIRSEKGKMGSRPVRLGQRVGFRGCPDYKAFYPYGNWTSMNVICTEEEAGKQTFSGFGLPPDSSEGEICQLMVDHYNSESPDWHRKLPSDAYQKKKEKALSTLDRGIQLTEGLRRISEVPGFSETVGIVFNEERILQMAKADHPTVLKLCTVWKASPCRIVHEGTAGWNPLSPGYQYLMKIGPR